MTTDIDELPAVMRIAELAKWLHCSRAVVYAEIASGRLECLKLGDAGRVWRVTRQSVERWQQSQRPA